MATKTKEKTYLAHGANFVCVIEPRDIQKDGRGRNEVVAKGLKIEFKHYPEGFTTDDPYIQERLEASPGFNIDFHCVGEEPGAIHPTFPEVLDLITDAVADLDETQLGEVLEKERTTHGRSEIIKALSDAVDKIRAKVEELEAEEAAVNAGTEASIEAPPAPAAAAPEAVKKPAPEKKPAPKKPTAKRKAPAKKPPAKSSAKK